MVRTSPTVPQAANQARTLLEGMLSCNGIRATEAPNWLQEYGYLIMVLASLPMANLPKLDHETVTTLVDGEREEMLALLPELYGERWKSVDDALEALFEVLG